VLRVVPTFEAIMDPSAGFDDRLGPAFYVPSREEVLADLRQWIEPIGASGLSPELVADEGRPHEAIVKCATGLPADIIVIGTHGRTGVSRLLLGSVTEKVLRTAPCPVLTVPPAAPLTHAEVAFDNILCPVDFSPSSLAALRFSLKLAQERTRVTVLHAVEYLDPEEPCEHVDFDLRRYRELLVEQARGRLHAAVLAEAPTAGRIEEVVAINRAYREILRHAGESHTDLIVMGAQGHGGLELMLYGSNTQNVVRAATCPVLTIRA
jgi:nucleotide-binding universal stress UspA family protein